MRSKVAKSLLRKRCLKTEVSLPPFSENSARLHLVPPTSPARITRAPKTKRKTLRCAVARKNGRTHLIKARGDTASGSRNGKRDFLRPGQGLWPLREA